MKILILLAILADSYAMVATKRISVLVSSFQTQSLLLFLLTLIEAVKSGAPSLYFVAFMILLIKGIAIPRLFHRLLRQINIRENLGSFLNPQFSLLLNLAGTYLAWLFVGLLFPGMDLIFRISATAAFSIMLTGAVIMILRLKALAQVIGLLVMENGIFLLAASATGGMPFIVEMAIFLDVFVSVIILGLFIYRINELFTGIDLNQLTELKG